MTGTAQHEAEAVVDVPPSVAQARREACEPLEALRRALYDPSTPIPVLAAAARACCEAMSNLATLAAAAEAAAKRQ